MSNPSEDLITIVVLPDDYGTDEAIWPALRRALLGLHDKAKARDAVPIGEVHAKRITVTIGDDPMEHEAIRLRLNVVPKERASFPLRDEDGGEP